MTRIYIGNGDWEADAGVLTEITDRFENSASHARDLAEQASQNVQLIQQQQQQADSGSGPAQPGATDQSPSQPGDEW